MDQIPAELRVGCRRQGPSTPSGFTRIPWTRAWTGERLLTRLLRAHHRLSGIPVLCNTSANLNGSDFFPDAASAMEWGHTDFVWADGVLFSKA